MHWGHSLPLFFFSKQGSLMLIIISSFTGLLFLSLTSEIKPNLGDYLPTFVNHMQSHPFLKSDLTIELINFMLNPLKFWTLFRFPVLSGYPFHGVNFAAAPQYGSTSVATTSGHTTIPVQSSHPTSKFVNKEPKVDWKERSPRDGLDQEDRWVYAPTLLSVLLMNLLQSSTVIKGWR